MSRLLTFTFKERMFSLQIIKNFSRKTYVPISYKRETTLLGQMIQFPGTESNKLSSDKLYFRKVEANELIYLNRIRNILSLFLLYYILDFYHHRYHRFEFCLSMFRYSKIIVNNVTLIYI